MEYLDYGKRGHACGCAYVFVFWLIKSIYKISLSVHKTGNFWVIQESSFQDVLCRDNANWSASEMFPRVRLSPE